MRVLRMLTPAVAALCLSAGLMAQTAEGTLWRYVHPEAKFLLGVDWQKAKVSPVGKMLSKKLTAQPGPRNAKFDKGVELLDKVNLVLVSSPSVEGMSAEGPGRVVVALEGAFDKAEWRKLMPPGTAVERFKGVDLFVPLNAKPDEMLAAYVSPQFALLGDRASITEVLGSAGGGLKDQSLMERATHLASHCEMWLVANTPPQNPGAPVQAGPMQQLQDMESLELGVELAKGLGLEMNMNMKNVEAAQGVSMMAQMFMSMAANQTRESDEITRALKSMKVTQNGKQVHMALNVPTATLERGMVAMKSSIETKGRRAMEQMLSGGFAGAPKADRAPAAASQAAVAQAEPPAQPSAPPPPPAKRTIRIVGLDTGDREVSYTSGRRQ